jgi:thiol-disulfide isomerase/thioredoxin
MKKISLLIMVIALNGALLLPVAALAAGIAGPAPAFELSGGSGAVNLAQYRGKLVYLDFWASWCGPCKQSFPWMNEMQAKYGKQGLQVIGINLDMKSEDGHRFLSTTPAQFIVAFDPNGDTPRKYQVKGMPTSVLIGRDGMIISEHMGFNNKDRADLERTIASALEQRN